MAVLSTPQNLAGALRGQPHNLAKLCTIRFCYIGKSLVKYKSIQKIIRYL